jgi:hypothetical protein
LIVIAAAGLLLDAVVHFHLAGAYSGVRTDLVSEGDLFRVEATVAAIVAVALLIRPRRYTAAAAFLVAAAGVIAVVVTGYVNVGAVGPLPNLYDPSWYAEKTLSAVAEGIAAAAALLLFVLLHQGARRADRATRRATA